MIIVPETYYDEVNDMMIKYYWDIDGVWYSYDHITWILEYNNMICDKIYQENVIDSNKREYEIEIENNYGEKYINQQRYINTIALFELIKRNEERCNKLRNIVKNIEIGLGVMDKDDEQNHILKINLNLLQNQLESGNKDYDELASISNSILKTPGIQNIIDTPEYYPTFYDELPYMMYPYNPTKEELKEQLCEAVDNDALESFVINESKLKKDNNAPTEEERKVLYKRNRENQESTVPEWIKNVVK